MQGDLGGTICQYRQIKKMTQEEFASRLGVTPQAVSKWERGNGLPDVSLLKGICEILEISPNVLLGMDNKVVENGNISAENEIKSNMIAEPLVLEVGLQLIPCVMEGLKTDYVNEKRKELVSRTGILLPVLRIRDNANIAENAYRIMTYDNMLYEASLGNFDNTAYKTMIDQVISVCKENYDQIINKQIVKSMIDNLKERFPGIAEGLIPEKISYLRLERKLQEKIRQKESIRDLIHILEEMEELLKE